MDRLTFIAELIKALAWPGTVLLCFLIIRRPLLALLPSLKKLRIKNFEIKFEKKLEQISQKAEKLERLPARKPPSWVYDEPNQWSFVKYIERLALISPQAAIVEAWRQVESALRAIAKRQDKTELYSVRDIIDYARTKRLLPDDAVDLLPDLWELRNQAAHATEVELPQELAVEFGRIAQRIIASLSYDLIPA